MAVDGRNSLDGIQIASMSSFVSFHLFEVFVISVNGVDGENNIRQLSSYDVICLV